MPPVETASDGAQEDSLPRRTTADEQFAVHAIAVRADQRTTPEGLDSASRVERRRNSARRRWAYADDSHHVKTRPPVVIDLPQDVPSQSRGLKRIPAQRKRGQRPAKPPRGSGDCAVDVFQVRLADPAPVTLLRARHLNDAVAAVSRPVDNFVDRAGLEGTTRVANVLVQQAVGYEDDFPAALVGNLYGAHAPDARGGEPGAHPSKALNRVGAYSCARAMYVRLGTWWTATTGLISRA